LDHPSEAADRKFATVGRINFNLHEHSGSGEVTYETGRGKIAGDGSITAPFAGDHSWFWRNRDKTDLRVTLQLSGAYREIVRPLERDGPCLLVRVISRSAKNRRIGHLPQSANIVLLILKFLIIECLTC
jgi:hypothetical protein